MHPATRLSVRLRSCDARAIASAVVRHRASALASLSSRVNATRTGISPDLSSLSARSADSPLGARGGRSVRALRTGDDDSTKSSASSATIASTARGGAFVNARLTPLELKSWTRESGPLQLYSLFVTSPLDGEEPGEPALAWKQYLKHIRGRVTPAGERHEVHGKVGPWECGDSRGVKCVLVNKQRRFFSTNTSFGHDGCGHGRSTKARLRVSPRPSSRAAA